MKRSLHVLCGTALLGLVALLLATRSTTFVPVLGSSHYPGNHVTAPVRCVTTATPDNVLVTQGQLWETMASSARDRANRTMPVAAAALEEAQVLAVGGKLRIKMSPRIPALAAEVSGRSVAPDGTTVTRLHIDGEVPGTLILQNNPATGFFLGQLYYDGLAVAYEFHLVADGLTVTRHEASELVCAFMNATGTAIASRGLPPVDMARVQGAMDVPPDNPTGSPVVAVQLGGKTVTAAPAAPATGSTLSVNDVAMLEGNAGTTNMVFTVNLSQANSKKIVTAKYATANGSATAGADYTALSGTVTFPKGSTTQTIAVPIRGDATVEANETFALILTNPVNATIADATGVGTIIDDDGAPSNVPVHNSLPGAVAVAYLDMDGQVDASLLWSASTIIARGIADTLSQDQMSDIWRRVTEDYAPFQINVTTDERVFLAAPPNCRIRCIITPDSAWYYAVVGGISYVNSFTWPGDVACWVFSDRLGNSPRYIAEACSHEIGHTLGLGHHGRISPAEIYYAGQGSGPVGWAPIMGVGYYQALVQWSKGEYLSSNNSQDDLAIITSQNGFGYRADQNSNTTAGATPLTVSGTVVAGAGIIETRDDVDVFSFTTHGGLVTIEVTGDATSSNLDILAEIKDAAGNTLVAVNPDLLLNASIVTNLSAGTYYLQVSGVGRGDYLVDGYTDYGSLGQYAISGNVP